MNADLRGTEGTEGTDKTMAPERKPWAVLRLTDLRVARLAHRDEMDDAIAAMRARGAGFVPLRWHTGAETWVAQGVQG